VGAKRRPPFSPLKSSNRHGLIAGATGTARAVTLADPLPKLSAYGCPGVHGRCEGDLSASASRAPTIRGAIERAKSSASTAMPAAPSDRVLDLFGEKGHPVRTTVTEIVPVMARLLQSQRPPGRRFEHRLRLARRRQRLLLCSTSRTCRPCCSGPLARERRLLTTQYGDVAMQASATILSAPFDSAATVRERFFGEPCARASQDMIGPRPSGGPATSMSLPPIARAVQSPAFYKQLPAVACGGTVRGHARRRTSTGRSCVLSSNEASLIRHCAPSLLLDKIEHVVRLSRSSAVASTSYPDIRSTSRKRCLGQSAPGSSIGAGAPSRRVTKA